jgi:hypothetical protein
VSLNLTEMIPSDGEDFADWSVLDDPEVVKVAERAAYRLGQEYADTGTIEYDDAFQEAVLILATKPHLVRDCLSDQTLGYGVLHKRLHQHLVKVVRGDAKRRTRQTSFEANLEALGEAA